MQFILYNGEFGKVGFYFFKNTLGLYLKEAIIYYLRYLKKKWVQYFTTTILRHYAVWNSGTYIYCCWLLKVN